MLKGQRVMVPRSIEGRKRKAGAKRGLILVPTLLHKVGVRVKMLSILMRYVCVKVQCQQNEREANTVGHKKQS